MKLRSVVAMILAVVMLLALASVSLAEEGKIKVSIWHTFTVDQEAYLLKAASDFNAIEGNKYEVEVLSQASSGFTNMVYSAVISGVGPDIIFNFASAAAEYVDLGRLADLSQYIYADETGIADFDTSIDERVMEGEVNGFTDGLIHYLPAYNSGPILFYNVDMYKELGLEVPTTWAEMEANCKIIYEAKGVPGLGIDSLTDCLQMIIMESGSGYIDVENKCVLFDTPEVRAQVQWLVDCAKAGYFVIAPSGDYFSTDFSSKIVGSYIGSCVGYPYVEPDGFEFAMAPMPAQTWYPSWNRGPIVFYYDDDARAEGAYEFVKYFISPEVNLGWVKAVNALSPYSWTKALDGYVEFLSEDSLGSYALQAVDEHLDIIGTLPSVTGASTVRSAITDAVTKAVNSDMTVDEAWTEAIIRCNTALKGE